jgi:predicted metal-dependent peptidase
LDDLADIRVKGAPGRGGTSFHPPFAYLDEEGIVPDTMIYLTDMMGAFPEEPRYPTVWCATSDIKAPFGETVRVKV